MTPYCHARVLNNPFIFFQYVFTSYMFEVISEPEFPLENPYISVVIIAYDRKEFILEAVKSVIDQTLERSKYEIIVVKNYLDREIDKFLEENDVFNIYSSEKHLGAKLSYGIGESRGEVVSFLEDDDLYLPFKLKEVYEVFQGNKDVIYFKHSVVETRNVDNVLAETKEKQEMMQLRKVFPISKLISIKRIYFIQNYGVGNTSAISIRKNSYLQFRIIFQRLNYLVDLLFFFLSLLMVNKHVKLCFQSAPLSIYRMHDSWTGYDLVSSQEDFLKKNLKIAEEGVKSYEIIIEALSSEYKNNRGFSLLLQHLDLGINAWNAQAKLIEGKKCTFNEIIPVVKAGYYKKDLQVLVAAILAFFSYFSPYYTSKIFRFSLTRVQFK